MYHFIRKAKSLLSYFIYCDVFSRFNLQYSCCGNRTLRLSLSPSLCWIQRSWQDGCNWSDTVLHCVQHQPFLWIQNMLRNRGKFFYPTCLTLFMSYVNTSLSYWLTYLQIHFCQKHLFLHQLSHNMTKYFLLNYLFNTCYLHQVVLKKILLVQNKPM